jgi:hypothetical protein
MSIDDQLQKITNRVEFERAVLDIPDDAEILVLIQYQDDNRPESATDYITSGNYTLSTLLWMVSRFQHWLMKYTFNE